MLSVRLPVNCRLSVVKFGVVKVICRFQLHRGLISPPHYSRVNCIEFYIQSLNKYVLSIYYMSALLCQGYCLHRPCHPHQRVSYVKQAFHALHLVNGTIVFCSHPGTGSSSHWPCPQCKTKAVSPPSSPWNRLQGGMSS